MLTLRFQRQGKKKDFIFRIIAVDSKVAINSGKSKEILGWWDPRINKFELKKERILYWISQGAQPSDSCYNLLVRAKIIEGKKRPINIRKKKEKKVKDEAETGSVEKTEQAPATEEKPIEEKPTEGKPKKKPEEKAEEKPVEETKVEGKKEEKKKGVKTEEKKEEVKEKSKKDIKKKAEKEEAPKEKTEK